MNHRITGGAGLSAADSPADALPGHGAPSRKQVVTAVSSHYEVDPLSLADLSEPTGLSSLWRFRGDGFDWTVRWQSGRRSAEMLGQLVTHLRRLELAEHPAERLVSTAAGRWWVPMNGGALTVQRFIHGRAPSLPRALHGLADYHATVWDWSTGARPGDWIAYLGFNERASVQRAALDRLQPGWAEASDGGVIECALEDLQRLCASDRYRGLPRIPIHGDARPGNMVDDGHLVHLIDFDFLTQAPRMADVCGPLAILSLRSFSDPLAGLAAHLDAYDRAAQAAGHPLTTAERAFASVFLRAQIVGGGILVALELDDRGVPGCGVRLRRAACLLRRLESAFPTPLRAP